MLTEAAVLAIPAAVADLTPEWLTAVLRASRGASMASVRSCTMDSLGGGESLLSDVVRLTLTYAHDGEHGPRDLVAKLPSTDTALRQRLFASNGYQGEADFYREFAADAGVRTARCYYADYDTADQRFCLLLEYLTGGAPGSNAIGATEAQIRRAIVPLARMHARWWGSPRLDRPWLRSGSGLTTQMARLPGALPVFMAGYGDSLPVGYRPVVETIMEWLPRKATEFRGKTLTLVHADYAVKNIFFPDDAAAEAIPFDWQLVGRAEAARDLVTLLVNGAEPSTRVRAGDEALRLYHETLSGCGLTGYSMDDLRHDFRLAVLLRLGPVIMNTAGNAEMAAAMTTAVPRVLAAAEDIDAAGLL